MADFTLRKATEKFPNFETGEKAEEHGQHVHFKIEMLPEIGLWEPGREYKLVVKVVQKSHHVEREDGKVEEGAGFEILEVGAYHEGVEDNSAEVKKRLR